MISCIVEWFSKHNWEDLVYFMTTFPQMWCHYNNDSIKVGPYSGSGYISCKPSLVYFFACMFIFVLFKQCVFK